MNDKDASAFVALFKEAYQKCFGIQVDSPLSETESKHLAGKIFDATGLVIGPKSIKNYSFYVLNGLERKEENPAVATLDTIARYVLNAPFTSETQRKNKESHYPYWYRYKEQYHRQHPNSRSKRLWLVLGLLVPIVLTIQLIIFLATNKKDRQVFTENFASVANDSLRNHGWFVQSEDTVYWNMRGERPGYLGLFTLKGDNWPDSIVIPGIRNLLLRKINAACFTAEVQFSDFIPFQNWQQAGILLLEDTSFSGKSLRLSLAYNDFFGGYKQKAEVIIQAITSQGKGNKPEEIAHQTVFKLDNRTDTLVINNLRKSALRIEKQGKKFRLLFSTAPVENFAFKELLSPEFNIKPKYIGIFALKGQVDSSGIIPAWIKFFSLIPEDCD